MTSYRAEVEPFKAAESAPPLETEEADIPLLDVSTIVEEAELFLRESAPHDFDVLVIGGGSAGCAAALRAAQLGARVGLVEQDEFGGSHLISIILSLLALRGEPNATRNHPAVAAAGEMFTKSLNKAGVRLLRGRARFIGEHTIEVAKDGNTESIRAVHIVIAVGTLPRCTVMPVPGQHRPLSLEELLMAKVIPDYILIRGHAFEALAASALCQKLGSRASVDIVAGDHEGYDDELLDAVRLKDASDSASDERPTSGVTLVDLARTPATRGLGIDVAGVAMRDDCPIADEFLETNVSGVYAVGGCIRGESVPQLSIAEGNMVAERIVKRAVPSLAKVPYSFSTDPPVAFIGLSERAAKKNGMSVRTGRAYFENNPATVLSGNVTGWVKMVVDAETDRLLGCQIVGGDAREIVNVVALSLNQSQNIDEFVATVMSYPSYSETARQAALATRGENWGHGAV